MKTVILSFTFFVAAAPMASSAVISREAYLQAHTSFIKVVRGSPDLCARINSFAKHPNVGEQPDYAAAAAVHVLARWDEGIAKSLSDVLDRDTIRYTASRRALIDTSAFKGIDGIGVTSVESLAEQGRRLFERSFGKGDENLVVLGIDVGGTHIKVKASDREEEIKIDSGKGMTAAKMVKAVKDAAKGWKYDRVTIGYPGPVGENERPAKEPANLAGGWRRYDFEKAFGAPVKILNDALMQGLGSGDDILFLGLGTGLGASLVRKGQGIALELAHLPYKKGTFEDYVGLRGLEKYGKRKWRKYVFDVVARLKAAFPEARAVVLGGGNVKKLKELPPGTRAGDNANAFIGAYKVWGVTASPARTSRPGKD